MTDDMWKRALAVRGLVTRKVRAALPEDGSRVELSSPATQPYRRNFARIVNAEAALKWGAGNYRLQSMNDPPRVAVWKAPSVSGVPCGSSMSRNSMAWLRAYTERKFGT